MSNAKHQPVLLTETLEIISPQEGDWIIDATFGRGGHTREILKQSANVVAIDWDEEAIAYGETEFADEIEQGKLFLIRSGFSELQEIIQQFSDRTFKAILFDFGTSVDQLTSGERGFSLMKEGPLDMRMDTRLGVTAADLLVVLPEAQLAKLFFDWGGEREAKKIARAIKILPKTPATTLELADVIEKVKSQRNQKIHPATKVFQALRIAVNSELTEISTVFEQLPSFVHDVTVVTISFHEGEDRIVKQAFRSWEQQNIGTQLTHKPVTASEEEIQTNPPSRSAKLRAFKVT